LLEPGPQTTPTIVPVPACPGLGPYPGSVAICTTETRSPEMTRPFFVTLSATSASMNGGSGAAGGSELLPGSVVQEPPQPLRLRDAGGPARRRERGI